MKPTKISLLDPALCTKTELEKLYAQGFTCVAIKTDSDTKEKPLSHLIQKTKNQMAEQEKTKEQENDSALQLKIKDALLLLAKEWLTSLQNIKNKPTIDFISIATLNPSLPAKIEKSIKLFKERLTTLNKTKEEITNECREKKQALLTDVVTRYCRVLTNLENDSTDELIKKLSAINKEKTNFIVTSVEQTHVLPVDETPSKTEYFLTALQAIQQLKMQQLKTEDFPIFYVFYDSLKPLNPKFFGSRDEVFLNSLKKHEGIICLGKSTDYFALDYFCNKDWKKDLQLSHVKDKENLEAATVETLKK